MRAAPLAAWLVACAGAPTDPIEARIDGWRERFGIERAALRVHRCGEPWLDVRRGDDGPYAVASASKWVTAGVFLALHERGELDLDTPLSTWLPALGSPRRDATIRQALGHVAGFRPTHACIADPTTTLAECARRIDADGGTAPGRVFRYGNAGWTVAAAAAEAATGAPFDALLGRTLSEPMGWEDVHYGVDGTSPNPGVAGDLRIAPEQLLAYVQMLLDDGRVGDRTVLSPASVDAMWQGAALPPSGYVPPALAHLTRPVYGVGAWLDEVDPDGRVRVASAIGKFGFQPWIDRDRGIAAVLAVELHGDAMRDARPQPAAVRAEVAALADRLPPCAERSDRNSPGPTTSGLGSTTTLAWPFAPPVPAQLGPARRSTR